jgi:hypothetical protein
MLKTFREGQLVSVATDAGHVDGVVAHVASLVKVEVAVEEADGPVFRVVHPKALTPREQAGPSDEALRRVIHRAAGQGHAATGGASGRGRQGHTRGTAHRPTGR